MASLLGIDRNTGAALAGDEHLMQSVADIITTPIGARVMRRDYGCLLFEIIDRPFNRATRMLATMAIAVALARWEPRIAVRRIELEGELEAGQARVTITGNRTGVTGNAQVRLSIPLSR